MIARVAVLVADLESWVACEEKPFDEIKPQEWLDEFNVAGAIRELGALVREGHP